MLLQESDTFSPREIETMRYEAERADKEMQYAITLKDKDIELAKLEAKWNSLLKIPITIVKLPIFILFGVAYIVHAIVKIEPSQDFWKLLK